MGREVRKVPANWKHPIDKNTGNYKPLHSGEQYEKNALEFIEITNTQGLQAAIDWCGKAPDINDYMPNWPLEQKTHYMMYEDTSEGTPISPAFSTPEELARWLVNTNASAFGSMCADYDSWLRIAKGGWAPSLIMENGILKSGVEGIKEES